MKPPSVRAALTTVAITLVLTAAPSHAIAPVIALLAKQLLQDMVTTSAKSMLMDSLHGLGCKGTALANTISSLGSFRGGGLGMTGIPGTAVTPNMPGMSGMAGMPGIGGSAGMPPEMAAMMAGMVPGGGLDAGQSAMVAQLMQGVGTPLTPPETIATIDEMSELGLLSAATSSELKDCVLLLPQSAPAMGMAMGMMKTMLPQFREARDQMRALSPAEQDELASTLAQELDKAPAADRRRMLTELGGGLFPPRVVESLNKRYGLP